MDIITEAKAISAEFKEIETEYNRPDSLIDMGNWYYISKKQDEVISRLVDRLEWKSIDSAPKDGSYIVCTSTHNPYARAVVFYENGNWQDWMENCVNIERYFTHWLPLPPVGDK